ncbi:unnamed protein product [Phytophthora fragariaefolia]|uniref:Unnamed protein product n=1 Tax=Phytophthora fragariaefolia TaxID=1490495 RepID=A0A9W6YCA7_9STRA|nr:unnamed protein product [Phytophthora fragariaefolia]
MSKTLFGRPTQFAVMLSPWHLVVHRVKEDDSAFAELLHSTITNFVGLDETCTRRTTVETDSDGLNGPGAAKRVRFANTHDGDSKALPVEPEPPDRRNDATTESYHVEIGEISPGAAERPPNAEDVDPLEV